jgi:catechol 2,3-dioxygenase-like lactoylglutathione lyase family enzyme
VGSVRLRFEGPAAGKGILRWRLRDLAATELDGLPTERSDAPPAHGEKQPNGVVAIDHVVAFTPDLDRTTRALTAAGLDFRRLREEPTPAGGGHQAFFRMGDVILEVVHAGREGPARLWGISFLVDDLDATVADLGDLVSEARDAVQPGRRIATLRREAGVGVAVAFMSGTSASRSG